ncbi:MAG TPA: ABC transporter ATP-binding protein [Stellaceae bacterium]|nr:ABC transporter ATP-binding protein [Stellaceae bacterium]
MAGAILELRDVSRHFGGLKAVNGVSLSIEEGTITSLVGPNGAGKTTVFNLITGILPLSSGDIRFDGRSIAGLPPYAIARRGLGRTFQDPRIFYEMSVIDHVVAGFSLRGENPLAAILRGPRMRHETRAARDSALRMLDEVGLRRRAHEKAQDLSFGEQRFLSILRTLAGDPRIVLLDEPTVGLDRDSVHDLTRLVQRMAREQKKTVLLVEHNLDVIFDVSDQVHLLVGGSIALSGEPSEIKRHPRMIEAYLGARYAALRP